MSIWSTGLRNAMLGLSGASAGVGEIFSAKAVLNFYKGTPPASADAAVSVWTAAGVSSTVGDIVLLNTVIRSAASVTIYGAGTQYGGLTPASHCLVFGAAANGAILGDFSTVWKAYHDKASFAGTETPTFWRLVVAATHSAGSGLSCPVDTGASSTTEMRIQGLYGTGFTGGTPDELVTSTGVLIGTGGATDQPITVGSIALAVGS